ncbi:hypothetical protein PG2054B_1599 [Bifidobacterium pseudolongum subsp. pseudolongum]|uniref:Uncharacterized protein n=1 Tax=Bifidobacterium pseudolongum subsp. pseudolongum TaxID=31954 RepID=A0A4Q5A4J8_9BIFI|nr:hypothetical protein [Bifidobacterium pseudolongum]RYQ18537.1 hypothetical protein PG2054B_1599 [Bifidobacterium pseudolongum subsp. pseudolongum]
MSPLDYVLEDARICLSHASDDPVDTIYRSMCGELGTYSLAIPYPGLCIITSISDAQEPALCIRTQTDADWPIRQEDIVSSCMEAGQETVSGNRKPTVTEPAADTREIPTIKNRLRELVAQRADAKYNATANHGQGSGSNSDLTEKRTATKGYR